MHIMKCNLLGLNVFSSNRKRIGCKEIARWQFRETGFLSRVVFFIYRSLETEGRREQRLKNKKDRLSLELPIYNFC